jgi:predicted O-linked N-acetylglucosamine transferase (SPINDLY family)
VSRLSDQDAAAAIEADGIDILVDLQGYTTQARIEIVALRPAPIIVNWIGYPATLGDSHLADYLIADRIVAPAGHEHDCPGARRLMLGRNTTLGARASW